MFDRISEILRWPGVIVTICFIFAVLLTGWILDVKAVNRISVTSTNGIAVVSYDNTTFVIVPSTKGNVCSIGGYSNHKYTIIVSRSGNATMEEC